MDQSIYPMIEVLWTDSHTTQGWIGVKQVEAEPLLCRTVGLLMEETDEMMMIASSLTGEFDDEDREAVNMDGIMQIPLVSVLDWHYLKRTE